MSFVLLLTGLQVPSYAKAQEESFSDTELTLFASEEERKPEGALTLNQPMEFSYDDNSSHYVSFTAKTTGDYYITNVSDGYMLDIKVFDKNNSWLASRSWLDKDEACMVSLKKGTTVYVEVGCSYRSSEYSASTSYSIRVEKKAWTYSLDNNGVLTIGGSGVVRADYSGFFADYADEKGIAIKKIIVGSNITGIPNYCFYNLPELEKVTIGKNVKYIRDYAFAYCPKLSAVAIGAGLEKLAETAFFNCPKLGKISVNSQNKCFKVYKGVLYSKDYKTLLLYPNTLTDKQFTIPSPVTKVSAYAFTGNTSIETLIIGKNVVEMGESQKIGSLLSELKNLKKVTISSENKVFAEKNGIVYSKDGKTLYYYLDSKKDTSFTVGSGVTTIAYGAISNDYLTQLTIPSSVQSMECSAVYGCDKLKSVTIYNGLKQIDEFNFSECPVLATVYLPKSVTTIGYAAFYGDSNIKTIYFSGTQKTWDKISKEYAFMGQETMKIKYSTSPK